MVRLRPHNPYLELAKKLTTRGFHIYLCSTPANLSSIEKRITRTFPKSIELVPLLLEVSPDLPANLHTTNGLPPHLMVKLKAAFDNSAGNFSAILKNLNPDLLIFDFLQPWAPSLAEAHHIPSVIFITSSSVMTSFMFHYFKNPDKVFPYKNIRFREYESGFMDKLLANSNHYEREKGSVGVEKSRNIVLITGFREIEGKYIDYVSELVGKRFIPVGPLVREPTSDDDGGSEILSWLDKKEEKSTVFVSFGSEFFLSETNIVEINIVEIARGLLLSSVNFIWVMSFPKGENVETKLPEWFVEGDRGKILEGWTPQTKILAHANVGGFVSHCGWNSLMESIKCGVPIIAVPMHLDQPINARLVEEIGVEKEVVREADGRLCGERLTVIDLVVVGGGGAAVRREAAAMKAKVELKGDQEIDEVAEELERICSKSSTYNL